MQPIIKFYFCNDCGMFNNKDHIFEHEKEEDYFGFVVYYDNINIYIKDIYTNCDSDTDSDFNEEENWLFSGTLNDIYHIIKNDIDIRVPECELEVHDPDFPLIMALYSSILERFF